MHACDIPRYDAAYLYAQVALEKSRTECRDMKIELTEGQHRLAELADEENERKIKTRSLQEALVNAKARALEADMTESGLRRYILHRQGGERGLLDVV